MASSTLAACAIVGIPSALLAAVNYRALSDASRELCAGRSGAALLTTSGNGARILDEAALVRVHVPAVVEYIPATTTTRQYPDGSTQSRYTAPKTVQWSEPRERVLEVPIGSTLRLRDGRELRGYRNLGTACSPAVETARAVDSVQRTRWVLADAVTVAPEVECYGDDRARVADAVAWRRHGQHVMLPSLLAVGAATAAIWTLAARGSSAHGSSLR